MSVERVVMPPAMRSALARQTSAAEQRDHDGLVRASKALVAAGWSAPSGYPVRTATLSDRIIGSLLLSGAGSSAANAICSAAIRDTESGQTRLSSIPEADWSITETLLLRELRLLGKEWKPLPGMPGRRDQRILGAAQRRALRSAHGLFVAAAAKDAKAVTRAIAAVARTDPSSFSVLAYALYRQSGTAGLAVSIPRKYDFASAAPRSRRPKR